MSSSEIIENPEGKVVEDGEKHPLEATDSFEEHMRKDLEKRRKAVGEKAKEKGYRKNEDGVWVRHDDYGFNEQTGCWESGYGDGFDEPVEWFKLDEEYPDLADRTEELAEKYHVEYDDHHSGLKEHI